MATFILLASSLLLVVFVFVEYAIRNQHNDECKHTYRAIYDSHHKIVCVDCKKEFSINRGKK